MTFKIESNITPIPNIFIEEYMPDAPAAYAVAYLYAFRLAMGHDRELSNKDIAQRLSMLESDVVNGWKYWQEQGLISLHEDDTVEFLPVLPKKKKEEPKQLGLVLERRPQYSAQEIAVYLEKSSIVKDLFTIAQEHLGKLLSQNDMSVIFSFYDWLRLPPEVIDILLAYCVQGGHRNLNYIEKVAIGWSEDGIDTQQKAMEYIETRKTGSKEILRAFGIAGRLLNPPEEAYVKKWLQEYKMPLHVVCKACEKTIMQTGKPSFGYADKIITSWKEAGIQTLEAVEKEEADFQAANKAKQAQKEAAKTTTATAQGQRNVKVNRFVNYEQRQWDFEELERLAQERLQQDKK